MRVSGVKEVKTAPRPGSASAAKADVAGFEVMSPANVAKWDDNIMVLTPDEGQRALCYDHLEPNMKEWAALAFAHGLNVHFGLIEPRADIDVFMIAPKGPGYTVRSEYERGAGRPSLLAVHANPTGNCHDIGLGYGAAIGGARAGII